MLETSDENVMDGEKNKRMGARKRQTKIDTGIKGDKGGINLFWTCGEKRTWNGE